VTSALLRRAVLLALLVLACAPQRPSAPSADPNASVVVPYKVAGDGEVRFTVRPRYTTGSAVPIELDIKSGTLQIIGPLSGAIFYHDGAAPDQVARRLDAAQLPGVDVQPGKSAHATITWDGKYETGEYVGAGTYSLALDFIVGGDVKRVGTVVEIAAR
jgi:hypothetical protein